MTVALAATIVKLYGNQQSKPGGVREVQRVADEGEAGYSVAGEVRVKKMATWVTRRHLESTE